MTETMLSTPISLRSGETSTAMMFYTANSLIWGNLIHHEEILPSRILVGITIPEFVSIYQAKILFTQQNFISKPIPHSEIHIPSNKIIGYHLMPPQIDQIDYDKTEPNRKMEPIAAYLGAFTLRGLIRISEVTTVKSNLEVLKAEFITLYDLEICHSHKTEMSAIRTNMGYFRIRENIFAV